MRGFTKLPFCLLLMSLLYFACQKSGSLTPVAAMPPSPDDVAETASPVLYPVTKNINHVIGGYYAGLPARYALTNKNYPLLVFLPGGGQMGNGQLDLPLLLNDGVMQLLDEKKFPASFSVKDKTYSFIVLTPQFSFYPTNADIASFIAFAKIAYRIDTSRMYLSGLSLGGTVTAEAAAAYPLQFAAIVPISGVITGTGMAVKAASIAQSNLPVWIIHNNGDPVNNVTTATGFYAALQSFHPAVAPRLTLFPDKVHDAWTKTINPSYKENGQNIYEWMLQYTR